MSSSRGETLLISGGPLYAGGSDDVSELLYCAAHRPVERRWLGGSDWSDGGDGDAAAKNGDRSAFFLDALDDGGEIRLGFGDGDGVGSGVRFVDRFAGNGSQYGHLEMTILYHRKTGAEERGRDGSGRIRLFPR